MHAYLFEAKSIQAYIFRSGKLKDLIAASERLDRLINDVPYSTLNRVLEAAQLDSNLLDADKQVKDNVIGFTRCKGSALYAFCEHREPLEKFRSLWTLTVLQLFPGMEFTDALTSGGDLGEAIAQGHEQMAQSRNTPKIKFPIASAVCENAPRSGMPSVPLSPTAREEVQKFQTHNGSESVDIDTEHHRQAYRFLNLRKDTLLGKFTGDTASSSVLPESLTFPLDVDDFPGFKAADGDKEVVRDLALIHADGNGIGLILRKLQEVLRFKENDEFSRAFRLFSTALANATQAAAAQATEWLYMNSQLTDDQLLPMRPIVLGGDDITLLCQADLALGYAEQFCHAFKKLSEQELKPLYDKYLIQSNIKPYLTASGGVLYHKANHPFSTCHQLVEGLCDEAKMATKEVDVNVGPAALSFYRIGSVLAEDIKQLRHQTQRIELSTEIDDITQQKEIISSLGGYLLEDDENKLNSLKKLRELADKAREKRSSGTSLPMSIAKFRQMATHIATGDLAEAMRIYQRALEQQNKESSEHARPWILNQWLPEHADKIWLSDLLVYAHFNAPLKEEVNHGSH
ncbi:MAG: hypothetical protein Q4G44_07375 [Alcaligenaceae bacterium]|nr:hypothetical protein [Alcaligenaceae bacterium]